MDRIESIMGKLRRMARLSFENAVRLHEDAVLLFEHHRIPSALHTSALSIEELGKYFMCEDLVHHHRTDSKRTEADIQQEMFESYFHTAKQAWFAGAAFHFFVSKTLIRILAAGELEQIKQNATYVGFPRSRRQIDFQKRVISPFRASRNRATEFITAVNDYLIVLAVGIRKAVYGLDIAEVDDRLADERFELHLYNLWPVMRPSTKRHLKRLRRFDDADER